LSRRFRVSSGYFVFIRWRASSFEMKTTVFVSGKLSILARTAFISAIDASGCCSKKTLTSTSLRT
jgi:hypothetical protein